MRITSRMISWFTSRSPRTILISHQFHLPQTTVGSHLGETLRMQHLRTRHQKGHQILQTRTSKHYSLPTTNYPSASFPLQFRAGRLQNQQLWPLPNQGQSRKC
ncbi:hypothetical protein BLNAU_8839 [Blattamonas nauphoetae]|uniref:Uncharacterized protein n=1 Tax=Blattamonas nauphoetae TaxID=2049346 RepID=A0ABQ9XXR8_9EUKA|nr:hypothetical protein BLNAU_8839 [Blattamonas nauphoetae]